MEVLDEANDFIAAMQELIMARENAQGSCEDQEHTEHKHTINMLGHIAAATTTAVRKIDNEHQRLDAQKAAQRLQETLEARPKHGHNKIFGSKQPNRELNAVMDGETSRVTMQPSKVIRTVTGYFRQQMQPPSGVKSGSYLPEETARCYPWTGPGAQDRFESVA